MMLLDILHTLLNLELQSSSAGLIDTCDGVSCPGSAVSAIAAAYGTQGMWVMSDLVDQMLHTSLGALGPLLYVIAATGGLISLALGAPPRTYMWFFLGPAIYRWLIGTSVPVMGMGWQMAGVQMDQREVWRLSEVGLNNSNIAIRGVRLADGTRSGPVTISNNAAPSEPIQVPYFYAYYDSVISGTIQGLIRMTGMYNQRKSSATSSATSLPSELPFGVYETASPDDKWFQVSSLKWGTIQNITDARVQSPDLRTSLTRFFASECGERFSSVVDPAKFVRAMNGKGKNAPASIFETKTDTSYYFSNTSSGASWDPLNGEGYDKVRQALGNQLVPFPRELKNLLKDENERGFRKAIKISDDLYTDLKDARSLSCRNYLKFIVLGLRWEASRTFTQMMASLPPDSSPEQMAYNLLYGWNIRKLSANGDSGAQNDGTQLTLQEQVSFIQDLLFVHMVRNEMAIARPALRQSALNPGQISSRITTDSAEGHLRFVGVKNKSSEFYQWAMMMPHMQGILLYYLSIGYPFACLLLILPGMHKSLFTWMSFWAWAKMWDLGFAMVMALERSVWAMLGSNANINKAFGQIVSMQNWGSFGGENAFCTRDRVCHYLYTIQLGGADVDIDSQSQWAPLMRIFDRALTVGANLDLDLQNSYYVYIMAGLYFAVPVVAGQLVLGAKSGMTSLVGNIIGGIGQEAGRQASQGFAGDLQTRLKTNFNAGSQAAYAAAMRSSPLLEQAMNAGNMSRLRNMEGDAVQQRSSLTDNAGTMSVLTRDSALSAQGQGAAGVGNILGAGKKGIDGFQSWRNNGGVFKPGAPAGPNGAPEPSAGAQFYGAASSATNGVIALEVNRLGQHAIDNSARSTMLKAGYGVDGFVHKGMGTEWEMGSQNYGKQAQYEAEMAAWEARNAYSSAMSATAASLGGLPGGLEPGNLPQESTGMAMSGEMSAGANSAARWGDPYNNSSGFKWELGSRAGELRQSASNLSGFYTGYNPGILFNHGVRNSGDNSVQAVWGALDGAGGAGPSAGNRSVQPGERITPHTRPGAGALPE